MAVVARYDEQLDGRVRRRLTVVAIAIAAAHMLLVVAARSAEPIGTPAADDAIIGPMPTTPEPKAATAPSIERRSLGPAVESNAAKPQSAGEQSARTAGGWESITGMALPLALVLGVIIIGAAMFRKVMSKGSSLASALGAGGRAPGGVIEVLGRYPVARGQLLVLVKIDRRVLLLGHSSPGKNAGGVGGGFTTLCEMTDPEEVAAILQKVDDGSGNSFASEYTKMIRQSADDAVQETRSLSLAGRRTTTGADGDAADLWDEAQAQAELTESRQTYAPTNQRAVARGASFEESPSADAMSQLRLKLSALNGRATGGVA